MTEDDAPQMQLDLPEYLGIWSTYQERAMWGRVITMGGNEDIALRALSELPEASALDAIKANRAAVDLLVGRRWYVMEEAREAGATWEVIGDALGITKQGAQDYYRRQIEKQETLLPDRHDAKRGRAPLNEDEITQ